MSHQTLFSQDIMFSRQNRELPICEVANYLYCGVRVIGGSETCLKFLEDNHAKYNIQIVKRLPVSAAFHTKLMDTAVEDVKLE